MKTLILPVLLGTLLLASCRPDPIPPLDVPSGEAVLNGTWSGTLSSAVTTAWKADAGGRTYFVQVEGASSWANSTDPTQPRGVRELVTATAGIITARVPIGEGVQALAFRPAQGQIPARLLVYIDTYSDSKIEERDPVTLAVLDTWAVPRPARTYVPSRFNPSASRFEPGDGHLIDTLTHQAVPLNAQISALLSSNPQDVGWSTDMNWLEVTTYEQKLLGKVPRSHFISNATGAQQDGESLHPYVCGDRSNGLLTRSTEITSLPAGGAALSFMDGTIEFRRADGTLRQAVKLPECVRSLLNSDADNVYVLDYAFQPEKRIQISDGSILPVPAAQPLPAKTTHALKLVTTATWESKTTYSFTGTADWDGQTYPVTGTATSYGIDLRPQSSPPPFIAWQAQLKNADGSLFANAQGGHGATGANQSISLQLTGPEHDFAFTGNLTH